MGDREALRILLVARQEITPVSAARAAGCVPCCWPGTTPTPAPPRTTLPGRALTALTGRDLPAPASREQAAHQAEIRRLALALGQARSQLKDNRARLLAIVDDIAQA